MTIQIKLIFVDYINWKLTVSCVNCTM